jgi:hypothetical protein
VTAMIFGAAFAAYGLVLELLWRFLRPTDRP